MELYFHDIYDSVLELICHFGNQDINGQCCGDLSFIEYRVLKKLSEEPNLPIKQIGISLTVTKSGATRIIDRLERKGYAVRKHSHKDGRVCCVELTEKGKCTVEEVSNRYVSYLRNSLKDEELQTLSNINNALNTLVLALRQHERGSTRKIMEV